MEGVSNSVSSEASRNAKESLDLAHQLSDLLCTGLDRHALSLLVALCDRGANPEALAALVRELAPIGSGSVGSGSGGSGSIGSGTGGSGSGAIGSGSGGIGSGTGNGSVSMYGSGNAFRSGFRQY